MANFLQFQIQNIKSYSIINMRRLGMRVVMGIFFLATIFFSKATYATTSNSLGSATIAALSTSFCAGDSTILTLTGHDGGLVVGGPWAATYQFDSSTDAGITFWPVSTAGAGGSGSISHASPTATYHTPALSGNTIYRVQLTLTAGTLASGGSSLTTAPLTLTVNPLPAAITGNDNICLGATGCLTDATTGGTWSSTNGGVATVGTNGCVFGVATGTANIVYTIGTGCATLVTVTINATAPITGPSTVCVGSTIALTDATAGVTWSSSSVGIATVGSATGVVTGVSGGATTIIATSPLGCVALRTITVNTNPAAITGNQNICVGSTNCLTDATAGGTWSSSNLGVAIVGTGGCVTGSAAGTATISYILATGCYTVTTVSVNPLPAAISGTASVCVGQTTSLSDATGGGTWISSNTAVGTINAGGTVTGITAGTTIITYTSSFGCITTINVTVNPLAPITGNLNVCPGSTTTLNDAATGGTWSSSDITIATVGSTTGVVSSVALGTVTIIYSLPFGCTATASVTVQPNPAAITGPNLVCAASTISLTDATAGGTWSSSTPTVAIVGSSTGVVTGIGPGTSTITFMLPTGCYATYLVSVNPVSGISGSRSICVNATTALTDATAGGTWSSSNTAVGTVDNSGNVTGLTTGTTIISYVLGTGCTVTATITVNPLPAAITGNFNVCAWGGVSCLTDASGGGAWSSTLVIVSPTGCVTGFDTGVGVVSYTLPTGCTVTATVTVNPLPDPITGNTTVCAGLTTSLTDVSAGGAWSSSNTSVGTIDPVTGIVTGISGGTTEITYTLPTGCIADTTVTVEPAASAITGVASVCYGLTTSLTDASSGGTWSSSNITIATVGSTGIVTGTGAAGGTATITYTLSTGCLVTIVVTVNPLPSPITGVTSVCMGSTTALTDATAGGTWSTSNTAIDTVDASGNVYGVAAGTSTITYTSGAGCITTTTVVVYPIYGILGTASVCFGSTTSLSDAASGGTWSSSDITIATVGSSTGIVTGTGSSGGIVTITYTSPMGCTATIAVTVNTLPAGITGIPTVCVGQTTNLTDATPGGNWSSSNTTIAGVGATGIVNGNAAGTATITYTLATGCYTTTTVTVNPLSAITGTTSVCVSLITSLTDATAGGTWSSSSTAIGTVDGLGNVYGVSAGTTTISYILPTGCTATTIVTVYPFAPILGGNTGLCQGFTITLSDAATGGIWSSSNPGVGSVDPFGDVTGVSAGTATISYSLPGGCLATTTITVNSLAAITGPTSVCQGSFITLSDVTVGGMWSSSNTTVGTVDPITGVVDGISSGTTIISYSYGANCWAIYPVIVNPITPILGANTVCPGSTITLSDATAGGTWMSSNTTIGTIGSATGIFTGLNPGSTTIIYTLPTGCFATMIVTVDIVFPITGTTSICVNTTTSLTDMTAGGTWSSSNTAVATVGTTGIVTATAVAGTTNITYTLPSGCVAVVTVTVNPLPAPITGPTSVCAWGGTITLSDATAGGDWTSTLVLIDASGNVSALDTGVATITYTLSSGCSAYYLVTVNPLPGAINGTLAICQGLTTTLSDPSTPGGTWTSSVPAVATIGLGTGFVNAIAPGSTIITYTLPTGCYTDTLFTVNPLPAPISGVASVCVGLTTTLTDASIGGIWSSSNPAVGSVGSSTGIVTGVGAAGGTVTITYTLPTGCINTIIVTVNPLPTPILGPGTVCVGQTITLSDAGGGTWVSSNPGVASIDPFGNVLGLATGTSTIIYTLGTGCSITTIITVNALAPITGNPSVCIGMSTSLTDAVGGGTWSSSNTLVGTVDNFGNVFGAGIGTTTISYVLPSGCTATLVVTVYPLPTPILGTLTVCQGQTTSLTDGTAGGTWTSTDITIATISLSSGIVTGAGAGTVTIIYTLGSGCTVSAIVTVNPLAPISGPTNLCQTQTYLFTDAVGGGTWSSSNTAVATVDPIGNVTGVGVGTANITYITALGCTTTLTVTVNALGLINGSSELCVGTTTIFTDAVGGGTWTSTNTAVGTIELVTGVISGISAGTTLISYTLPSGCTATLIVTVSTLAPITGPTSVCEGSTITLADATPGGVWTSSNNTTATISSTGVVDGIRSGTAIMSYSYGPGCVALYSINVDPSTPILGNLNICFGLTTTLTDSTNGGTWSSSNPLVASITSSSIVGGFATVVITGVTTGTANITYTLPTGCIQTTVVTVSATAPISGMDSVCVGLTTVLTDATAGVTWSSSNVGVATIGSSTGLVTGITPGTTTITATSPVGCIITVVVTVNPNPSPILGPMVVCNGLTNCLTDATPGGGWSSSNTGIATIDPVTGCYTGVSAGTAIITYTLPTTCIAVTVITVNPLPAPISGTLAVCVNSAVVLTDATGGGTWSASNGNATIGSATGIVLGVTAGLDTITYTLNTGCIMTAVLTVNPLPSQIFGNQNVCLGSTNTFTDDTTGGVWSTTYADITIDGSGDVTGISLGTAIITYTLPATGCYTTLEVTVDPLPLPITGVDSVCVGLTISLSDPTFGGIWSSTNVTVATVGSINGIVTGINGGASGLVDTIVYTLGTGCTAIYSITVNPLPAPITGNFNVCIGTTNTLADATPGGTWTSSDTAVAPIDTLTGVVSGHALGTATITYTLITGCIITQEVTVDPLPLPITGSVPVCVRSSIQLSDATPGGTWTSSLVDTATVDNTTGIVTGVSSGTSVITYQLTATGCIATVIVTVNPLPNEITGPNSVCIGDSVQILDNTPNGTWSSQNTAIATIDSAGEVVGQTAGTAYMTYTLPTGCDTTYLITVKPLPGQITGDSVVCVGSSITLHDTTVGGTWTSTQPDTATIGASSGIVFGIGAGTTTISYESNLFCYVSKVITVNPIPTPIYGGDSVCNGLTRVLNDTSVGGEWSSSNTAITTVSPLFGFTTVVTGVSPGVDSIYYTFPPTGCHVLVTYTVNPIPVITVTGSPSAQICLGASTTLTASGAGTGFGSGYFWTPSTALSSNVGAVVVATPSVTITYTVVGTTQYGCKHDTTYTVYVDSLLLHLHITGKSDICKGEVDTLIASPRYLGAPDFTWSPATVDNIHGDTVHTTTDVTQLYTVTLVDSFGCVDSATFLVTVHPLPIITISPDPGIVCRGSTTQFTASGAATYVWFPDAFLSCDSCANPIASDTQNLVYNVIGTSIYGCKDSTLFPVSVLDTTKLTISNDTVLCLGQTAQLLATSTSVDGSHPYWVMWQPTNGLNDPSIFNPTATPNTTTTYTVIIKENVCFTDSEHVTVFVEPYPDVTITQSQTVVAGTMVQLGAVINNDVLLNDYEWTPSTFLSCEKCYNPIATPTTTTTYTFTATSNYGCVTQETVTIHLICDNTQVFIPNTFTPNGDGHNDRFFISGKGIGTITRLSVYNRWGELVFQSNNTNANDAGAGWDGTYKGVVLEPDVFVYVAEVTCELGGEPFKFKGDISLVR